VSSAYREYPPPAHLRAWVQCLWTLDSPAAANVQAAAMRTHRVLPDGCIDILFETAGAGAAEISVVGMMTRPRVVTRPAATSFTAVRFRPGAAAAFFREPLHRLTDVQVELRELWRGAGALLGRLHEAPAAADRLGLLAGALERRLGEGLRNGHAGCGFAVRALEVEPETRVGDLCARLGMSRQALARSFRKHVGVSPKTLGRVLRLQRAVRLLASGAAGDRVRWADLALDAGYYDQSHLVAEFKELVGLTPSAYLIETSARSVPFFQDGGSRPG
jgi:AraC-like DNA-binding protein